MTTTPNSTRYIVSSYHMAAGFGTDHQDFGPWLSLAKKEVARRKAAGESGQHKVLTYRHLSYTEAKEAIKQIKHGDRWAYALGLQTLGYASKDVLNGDHWMAQVRYNKLAKRWPRHFCIACCTLGALGAGKTCACEF